MKRVGLIAQGLVWGFFPLLLLAGGWMGPSFQASETINPLQSMKTIKTETFSINIPEQFNKITVAWESVRAEAINPETGYPMLTAALGERAFYEKYKGSNFAECFHNSCLDRRGPAEVIKDTALLVNGEESYVRTVKGEAGYFHFFAVLPVDDTYCYEFAGDCEIGQQSVYEPLFEQAWQSLRYFDAGNRKEAMEKQKAGIAAQFKKLMKQEPAAEKDEGEIPETPEDESRLSREVRNTDFAIPNDGKERWCVGDIDFEFLSATEYGISAITGEFYIKLKGRAVDYDEKKHSHILDDYSEGEVYLDFSLKGVYQDGVPAGTFKLEADKTSTYDCSFWKGGFYYNLEFYGTLTLRAGWVLLNGNFSGITGNARYPVEVAKKIPEGTLETLDWSKYRFTSIEEALPAPAGLVRYLYLKNPDLETFPDAFYDLLELRTLHINYYGEEAGKVKQLREIPARLAVFRQLKDLSLTGIEQVSSIPEELAGLKNLESLAITGTRIEEVPYKIWLLPKLEYLNLAFNCLREVQGRLSDSIKSLSLQSNRLTEIPDHLVKTANLSSLDIRNNPLEKVPAGIRDIEKLGLELEKKQLLTDHTYKGAGGSGTLGWEETVFAAKNDPELLARLDETIAKAEVTKYRKELQQTALKAVSLETADPDHYDRKGNTRFGGLPDLPPGMEYPAFKTYHGDMKGLQFIAQLNCADLAPYQDYLPRRGILYFFIEDQEAPLNCKVVYYDEDLEQLQSAKELDIAEEFIYDDSGIYDPYLARAETYPSLPYFWGNVHLYAPDVENERDFEEAMEVMEESRFDLQPGRQHALYKDTMLPVHGINNYVFKQHDTPQIEAADKLGGKPEEWMVLLSVESENKTGFQFWDAGTIYFVIHKSDLAKRDFSNVYYGLESS